MARRDYRRATTPRMPLTVDAYERAIVRTEYTFRRNASRMWVLKILREALAAEAEAEVSSADIEEALASRNLERWP